MDGVRVRNMNYIKAVRSVSTGQACCGIAPNCLETYEVDRNSLLLTNHTRLHNVTLDFPDALGFNYQRVGGKR